MKQMRWVMNVCALLCLATAPCAGATITLDAIESGGYTADGAHDPAIQNYLTGRLGLLERRSFFVFDLSSVDGIVNAATLRLFNPEVSPFLHGYVSPDPTETLNIYDTSTSAPSFIAGTAGVAGFGDLGSGALFGSQSVSTADNGTVVEIVLNAAALTSLNSAIGLYVLGSSLGTLGPGGDQYVFGFSMTDFVPNTTRQLVLDVTSVPEPSTIALGLIGAALLALHRKRKLARI